MKIGLLRQNSMRKSHPRPDMEIESRSAGSNKAVTRKMTEEDWAKYGPLNTKYPSLKNKINEEVIEMKKELTKEIYLQERIDGKGNAQIERDYGLSPNSIYPILKTWGLTAKEANELVASAKNPTPAKVDTAEVVAQKPSDSFIAATVERDQQILSKSTPKKSGRTILVNSAGSSEAIERELEALCTYVAAMSVKQYHIEVSLVEVSSDD